MPRFEGIRAELSEVLKANVPGVKGPRADASRALRGGNVELAGSRTCQRRAQEQLREAARATAGPGHRRRLSAARAPADPTVASLRGRGATSVDNNSSIGLTRTHPPYKIKQAIDLLPRSLQRTFWRKHQDERNRDQALPAGTWSVDKIHSTVGFAVDYMAGTFSGTFSDFDTVVSDGLLKGSAEVASVQVKDPNLEAHLQSVSPDFFDAERQPGAHLRVGRRSNGTAIEFGSRARSRSRATPSPPRSPASSRTRSATPTAASASA